MKKYLYPIITVENFEEKTKNLIGYKKLKCYRFGKKTFERYSYLKVKAPSTRNEFYMFTKNMFGEGMKIDGRGFVYSDKYTDLPLTKLWDKKPDGWRLIGHTTFGYMGTGGRDYGSYDYGFNHREQKRYKKICSSKLSIRLSKGTNHSSG